MDDPLLARKAWRALEAVHGMIYFAPDAHQAYAALGITDFSTGYFASRAAALGRVGPEVVIATFFNFCPDLVRRAIPTAWSIADPAALLAARREAADRALEGAFSDQVVDADVAEAAALARRAAEAACAHPEGRPLFAAHAALSWPDSPPRLVLWHAQTLLREFRGDGHVAALTAEGVTGIEALVLHAATGDIPAAALRDTRGWSLESWDGAVAALVQRDLLRRDPEPVLTDEGRGHRQHVEDVTDRRSLFAYGVLSRRECERLRDLGRSLSAAVVAAGLLPAGFGRR